MTVESRQQTSQDVVAGLPEDYDDVQPALSLMSPGELVHGCWRTDSAHDEPVAQGSPAS